MIARFLTAGIGIPVLLGLLYAGGIWWAGIIMVLTLLASWEMGAMIRRASRSETAPSILLLTLGGVLFVALAYESDGIPPLLWGPVLTILTIVAFVIEIGKEKRDPVHGVGGTLLGTLYPGALFAHLVLLRQLPHGFEWVLLVTLTTWASDSAAFFVGSAFGKHKLLPSVSPNKTWEGAIGALAGAVIVGAAFGLFTPIPTVVGAVGALFVSVAGQLGDLAASSLKRQAEVKDTGTLLPGHGGVLDRFDSLLFAGAVVYYGLLLYGGWPMG